MNGKFTLEELIDKVILIEEISTGNHGARVRRFATTILLCVNLW